MKQQWLGRPGVAGRRRSWSGLVWSAVLAVGLAPAAFAQFVEPDVDILYTLESGEPGDSFGWVGANVGDLDGDGASEIVIGAIRSSEGGPLSGKTFVYSGRSGRLIHEITGRPYERLGFSVAALGDATGDGVPDYAVSGPGTLGGTGRQPGRLIVVSGADHSIHLDIEGPGDRSFFGYDVNAAGDVDGDGRADILVGAPLDSSVASFAGRVHVISGRDGSTIWISNGPRANAFYGSGVSQVGDQNGDGTPDQAVGAVGGGNKFTGEAYVLDGSDGALMRVLKPKQQTGYSFGDFFVHDAGDIDQDGLTDIYVGDFNDSDLGEAAGRAYVFYGGRDEREFYDAEGAGDGFGVGRGIHGDVDADGHPDLVIAGFKSSAGALLGGKAFVYSGRNGKLIRTMTGNIANERLGFDALSLGDVNDDGLIDFLITGVSLSDGTGRAHVIAGNPAPEE